MPLPISRLTPKIDDTEVCTVPYSKFITATRCFCCAEAIPASAKVAKNKPVQRFIESTFSIYGNPDQPSPNQDGRPAHDNRASMGGHIPQPGGGQAHNK